MLQANRQLRELREIAKGVTKQLPDVIQNATAKIDEYARGMISGTGSTLFEELGFYYIGPVDGHNLPDLIDVLSGEERPLPPRNPLRRAAQIRLAPRKSGSLTIQVLLHPQRSSPRRRLAQCSCTSSLRRAAATCLRRQLLTRCMVSPSMIPSLASKSSQRGR